MYTSTFLYRLAIVYQNIDSAECVPVQACLKTNAADQYKQEFVQAYDDGANNRYYLLGHKLKYYEYEELRSFPDI
jgi:hypothetical protein